MYLDKNNTITPQLGQVFKCIKADYDDEFIYGKTYTVNENVLCGLLIETSANGQYDHDMLTTLVNNGYDAQFELQKPVEIVPTVGQAMNPMMLMMLMGDDNGKGSGLDMKSLMMLQMMSGGAAGGKAMNPMMLMMLMGDKKGGMDMKSLMMMQMMSGGGNMFGATTTPAPAAVVAPVVPVVQATARRSYPATRKTATRATKPVTE